MKRDKFIVPGKVGIWRIHQKEGPPDIWLVHRQDLQATRFFSTKQEMLKWTTYPETSIPAFEIEEWITESAEERAPKPPDPFHQQLQIQQDSKFLSSKSKDPPPDSASASPPSPH